jgi:hypothetical protein
VQVQVDWKPSEVVQAVVVPVVVQWVPWTLLHSGEAKAGRAVPDQDATATIPSRAASFKKLFIAVPPDREVPEAGSLCQEGVLAGLDEEPLLRLVTE